MPIRIVWDERKRQINLEVHALDFRTVTLAFLADATIRSAKKGRLQAIGLIDGRAVSLIFAPLGTEAVSLVSLRAASEKERMLL